MITEVEIQNTFKSETYTGHSIVKSANLPVLLDDARRQLRLDEIAEDDGYITLVVKAVCDDIERQYTVALLTQTVTEKHCAFPAYNAPLKLLMRPGVSVTSVAYIDSAGDSQTFDSANYDVLTNSGGMSVVLKVNKEWPSDLSVRPDAVTVVYVAGYGDGASSVPSAVQLAVLNRVGKYDANREDPVSEKQTASDTLLQPFYQFKV